jgi:hypothetical protein
VRVSLPGWWRKSFLRAEFWLAVACASGVAVWVYGFDGNSNVDSLLKWNRGSIYAALASIFGSLLGFVITTLSIIVAVSQMERLAVVRESEHYNDLWDTFMAGIRAFGFATVVALVGLVGDRDEHPVHLLFVATVFAGSLAALRLARCVWILEKVLSVVVRPAAARKPGEA